MALVLCSQCHRHFRVDETACPFCNAPVIHARWGRTSFVGLALLGLSACGEDRSESPVYGTPVYVDAAEEGAGLDGSNDVSVGADGAYAPAPLPTR